MWLNQFLFGRPGQEYLFEINPEAMQIEESGIVVLQRNLIGDLKKSTLRVSAPIIKVNSSFLSKLQRDQFNSLVAVTDTFLSFQTRDDWTQYKDLATILDLTHLRLQYSSALRLSNVLVGMGFSSVITILGVSFTFAGGGNFGGGGFGGGGFGGTFDPGAISYNDQTYVVTITNPLPSLGLNVYVDYTYVGWLVNMEKFSHSAKGGWLDRFNYDFVLTGA